MKYYNLLVATLVIVSGCKDDFLSYSEDADIYHSSNIVWLDETIRYDYTSSDIVPWSDCSYNKSANLQTTTFMDGGMALIAGHFLPTVIIGNQRWTTMDYKGYLHDSNLSDWDNVMYGIATSIDSTVYYSYNLAMTLNNTPTTLNYYSPVGLVETSSWRIPSWDDENHLHYMTNGNDELINTWLNPLTRGMIYHTYSSFNIQTANIIPCVFAASESVHWNSEYYAPVENDNETEFGPYGTWHLTAMNGTDYSYLFQFQLMMPYAPIRLVQNITPIENQ